MFRCCFCLVNLVFIIGLSAQNKMDSTLLSISEENPDLDLFDQYDLVFRKSLYSDQNLAAASVDSMHNLVKLSKRSTKEAQLNNRKGSLLFLAGDYKQALVLYEKAYRLFSDQDNEKEASGILINIANCYGEIGEVVTCLETHMKSLSIQERLGITGYPLATNLMNIAVLHADLKNPTEALKWNRKAIRIFKKLDDSLSIAEVEFNMALNLYDVDSLAVSQNILDRLERYHRQSKNHYMLTDVLFESGKNYYKSGNFELSENALLEGLRIARSQEDKQVYGIAYNKLFELYMSMKDYKKAEEFALLSYTHTKDLGRNLELLVDIENLADMYEVFGEYEKSVLFHNEYKVLKDSIVGIEKLNAISELQTKYETEKKQQEIVLLKEKEKRTGLEKKALLGTIGGIVLFFIGLVYLLKQRIAKARLEKEKSQQELTFKKKELDLKNKELVAYTLQLAHKNEFLENIKSDVIDLERIKNDTKSRQRIVNAININQNDSLGWEGFKKRFQAVHTDFESNALSQYPELSANDLRLMSLLKMNLSSKEVASTLNISPDGVKKARYRLRKKLNLKSEESLEGLVLDL